MCGFDPIPLVLLVVASPSPRRQTFGLLVPNLNSHSRHELATFRTASANQADENGKYFQNSYLSKRVAAMRRLVSFRRVAGTLICLIKLSEAAGAYTHISSRSGMS